jgi:hypothetical protein
MRRALWCSILEGAGDLASKNRTYWYESCVKCNGSLIVAMFQGGSPAQTWFLEIFENLQAPKRLKVRYGWRISVTEQANVEDVT